uniref:Dystroglycan-type cadherin-like domain-containing protein n=1 Tax=Globodera rostochiensis TaxID=31243 RepID=A0A914HZF6_GLORO
MMFNRNNAKGGEGRADKGRQGRPIIPSKSLLLFFLLFGSNAQRREHAAEVRAVKGQLFVHMLHSAYFFPQTVEVKWSASAQGRPSLPHWLHLFPSRHRSIAFLLGTPVSPHSNFPIHVIARRLDTFQSIERSFSIVANDDLRFNGAVQQIVEIRINNMDAEELIWDLIRGNKMAKGLERAIYSTFKGRGVNPFIFNILPGTSNPPSDEVLYRLGQHLKIGAIVQVGTQAHFHPNVLQLTRGIQLNPEFCSQNKLIPMDRHFRLQQIVVDWCKLHLRNMTLLKQLEMPSWKRTVQQQQQDGEDEALMAATVGGTATAPTDGQMEQLLLERSEGQQRPVPPVYYIWESVLVFPLLAVFCLLFILCLSLIFFGRREGQYWRDYKTPKDQLCEYLNLRESQRQLRELSTQRQVQMMSRTVGREPSEALSIGTFLRPREKDQSPSAAEHRPIGTPRPEFTSKGTITSTSRSSIGKQTVAEAARVNGVSIHPYRHPLDSEDEDDEDEGGVGGRRW